MNEVLKMKKTLTALFFALFVIVNSQAQVVKPDACGFSEYKPLRILHFQKNALIEQVKPEFPLAAKAVEAQGTVQVQVLVDRSGVIQDACVLSGHPLLRAAALKAALASSFKKNFGFSKAFSKNKTFVTEILLYRFIADDLK